MYETITNIKVSINTITINNIWSDILFVNRPYDYFQFSNWKPKKLKTYFTYIWKHHNITNNCSV